jgi:hypothetical protein
MKKYSLQLVSAVAVLFACTVALAGTGFWTKPAACGTDPCVKVSFGTGTGSAPVDLQPDGGVIGKNVNADGGVLASTLGLGPQAGLSLGGLAGFTVTVKMNGLGIDAGGAFTAGTLQAWLYDPAVAAWVRSGDLDVTVEAALTGKSFPGWEVPAKFGRITFVPSGLGQPCDIYIHGQR